MAVPRIVVVGSVNMDLVVPTAHLPMPGETVLGRGVGTVPGGKGANQAIAAARAGASCSFVGTVGDDPYAEVLRKSLAESGVDVSRLRAVPGPSGVALVVVDDRGENQIVVVPGANGTLTLGAEDRAVIAGADVLLCQLEIPLSTVAHAAAAARATGTTVVLNAAPARPLAPELLAAVDLLVVNQIEAITITGYEGPAGDLLDRLLDSVPRAVVTRGVAGVAYADRAGVRVDVPAPLVTAVDTTAAGDAFTGAFAVALAEHRPVADALAWASAAGALCVQRPGASSALPTRPEIDAAL